MKYQLKSLALPVDELQGWNALHIAASRRKYVECLKILLLRRGKNRINVNAQTFEGRTALHIACANNCITAVRCLLKNGAKTDICDDQMRLPLHYAAFNGRTEIVQLLLQSTDVRAIQEFFCVDPTKVLEESHIYWSLTCCAISSGNIECLAAVLTSKLPERILQSPTIVASLETARVFSPLTFLLHSYIEKPEKLDSFLRLLLKFDVTSPNRIPEMRAAGVPMWPANRATTIVYENPFSAIFDNSWPPEQQLHYFDLLIENNVTTDYCLQRYGDISAPMVCFNTGEEDPYLDYYKHVLDTVQNGKVDVGILLLTNSVILEVGDLIVHFWFSLLHANATEFSKDTFELLNLLTPSFHRIKRLFRSMDVDFAETTLKDRCRLYIRQQIRGPTVEDNLKNFRRRILELPLPSQLKDFLLFKN